MSKAFVALQKNVRLGVAIEADATIGATIGTDLKLPDGTIPSLARLAEVIGGYLEDTAAADDTGTPQTFGAWSMLLGIPPNVTALADTATTGLYTITGPGTSATRTLTTSTLDLANDDGVAGDPSIDLAVLADAGGGTLQKTARDTYGRLAGTSAATTDDLAEGVVNLYFTNERAQDAVGSIFDATLVYDDATPSIGRAAISGDITIAGGSNTAAITAGAIIDTDVNASAGISLSKLAALALNMALMSDGSGVISASAVTAAELGYLSGVTSAVQTQLDGKQPLDAQLTSLAALTWAGNAGKAVVVNGAENNWELSAGGVGTVTSVALTMPATIFDVSGSPITTSGTLAVTLDTQAANTALMGPTSGGDATPTFRTLVAADIPSLSGIYQPLDATLTALAAANWALDALPIGTGADTLSQVSFAANTFPAKASTGNLVAKSITDFGLSLVDDANGSAGLTTLGLSANGKSLVTAADYAAMRALLDLEIGVDVQAWDATLDTFAATNWALTGTADNTTVLVGSGVLQNWVGGNFGLGATPGTTVNFNNNLGMTGASTAYALLNQGTIQSDVISSANYFRSGARTVASAFTLIALNHYYADQLTIGAGSAVTSQYGFRVASTLTGATNNYGLYCELAAATGRWNAYIAGTARCYGGTGGWGFGSTTDVPSALIYMTSTTQGFRRPVMTTAQRDAISSPAEGLSVYDSTVGFLSFYYPSTWAYVKNREPRGTTTTTVGTATLNVATSDFYAISAQNGALTIANPTGTASNLFQIWYRIQDNGTSRALTWGSEFRANAAQALPTATTIGKWHTLSFVRNVTDTKWELVIYAVEP